MLRSRPLAVAVALLSTSLAGASANAATRLTAANSIPFEFGIAGDQTFEGTDCGGTATFTRTVPPGSFGIKVAEPKVGDRDRLGATRVTAVTIAGMVVTVSIVADGALICDPAQTGVPPGEPVHWRAVYDVQVEHTRRVRRRCGSSTRATSTARSGSCGRARSRTPAVAAASRARG